MEIIPSIFEERAIRRLYDETTETWFFSVVDIMNNLSVTLSTRVITGH